nr:ATP-binding protein [Ureibacillus terrenus]
MKLNRAYNKRPRKNTWALFYAYFTLILMGPTGAGKTHLSVALGIHAVERGYKVSFVSMNQLMYILKTKEYINKSKIRYKRIIASDLIIIDDVMYMTYETQEANLFFQFIYDLYDKAAFILTSNKGPNEWGGSTSSFWTQKD